MTSSVIVVLGSLVVLAEGVRAQEIPFGRCEAGQTTVYREVTARSLYVPMSRDGVRIALDLFLPAELSKETRLPTMFSPTRYWRAQEGQGASAAQRFWVSHGYAVVTMDVRGTGASFGTWAYPWSDTEAKDIAEVTAWIAAQPWSNGKVVSVGTSYLANTAELVARSQNPAVKAIAPRFGDFDVVEDLAYPGGVPNRAILDIWGDGVYALDHNEKRGSPPRGVRPVDDDRDGQLLAAAVVEHGRNPRLASATAGLVNRDDAPAEWGGATMESGTTAAWWRELERSGVPILSWASWLDAGVGYGALKKYLTIKNPIRLIIGPWSHGAGYHASQFLPPDTPTVPDPVTQNLEVLCFFDEYVSGRDHGMRARQIIYYTLGEERWHTTTDWPPPSTAQRWYLSANHALSRTEPVAATGADRYSVDFDATTGSANRWHTQLGGGDVIYPDRVGADRQLLVYTGDPVPSDLEITGQPIVSLRLSSTATDGAFFVYLEDVAPDGAVTYITEGELRALHRRVASQLPSHRVLGPYHSLKRSDAAPLVPGEVTELRFGILSTSVLIKRGHRVRLAIAGADHDTFERIPAQGVPTITVERNHVNASYVDLPVVERR